MKTIYYSLLLLVLTASPCFAQGLSQIDFDGRASARLALDGKADAKLIVPKPDQSQKPATAKVITSVQDLKEQVESSAQAVSPETVSISAAATRAAPRARLKPVSWPQGVVGNHFITPSLKGVLTDDQKGYQHWVTSKHAWKKQAKKSCGEPLNEAEALVKSEAVREVLFRFSGNEEFASSQCSGKCEREGYEHTLTGVSFNNLKGGTFKFVESKNECRYRLTKHSGKKWEVLQPTRVSCACLPTK